MAVLDEILVEEKERLLRIKSRMQAEYNELPKGCLSKKMIHGSCCCYLQHREGDKVISKYVNPSDVEELSKKIDRRRSLKKSLREIDVQLKKIQKIAEHTGHGIPTIVNTYGSEVFEITDSSIKCTIPFNEYVLSQTDNKNVGLNVGLTKTEKKVIELLLLNSNENALTLSNQIGVVKRTVERALKSLQNKGYIERHGSKRDGSWIVKK